MEAPAPVDIDLFYELAVPAHLGRSEAQVYHETLDEFSLADTLGFHGAWLVEHHFMREYSHSSSPEIFLAAASQRTKNLRLGHAVVVLPYSHAVRVAERAAALDILSHGRLEMGIGRGFSPKEYQLFGSQMADSRLHMQEGLQILRQAGGGPFSHHGKLYHFDALDILPKPLQQPHPPLWTAAVSPATIQWAAREGIGVLSGPFKPWFLIKQDLRAYKKNWRQHHGEGPLRAGQNAGFAMTIGCLCLEDAAEARRWAEGFTWYYQRLLDQTRPVLAQLKESYEYYHRLGFLEPLLRRSLNLRLLETMGMVVVGDPATCRQRLARYARAGVDRLILAVGAGMVPSHVTQRSLRLLAAEVLPALRGTSPH
ncbi:LLM class flavin-dependent oxidoreductase [Acidithiobacillus sp.]|jgi:alkanesulfonate monooxygenase SsuD/methylene tetrahydromethanopterin reductase-like flavin-dependent oxidoreductase (luciferase family)|uniref:LLM class flavin-dependent oxidoreductase n=1 Tax=Acidithiobacillus sp. TaxID=1872118 RepID=UPI0025BE304F|nr:LLM class flavin-dependent oxidoreductase [Acidithiobacillus sp.]MCK9188535.1 LLM class flavin-dependent oxidoreductase [Acidithiobacillus sp.]MCK9360451.1 LLM class flavin-dependent oxidoreductase [Acidithiobacillus sp.]